MTAMEFVVFDADGKEVDSVDPYVEHVQVTLGKFLVSNHVSQYPVEIPPGGRYEIREFVSGSDG